MVCKEKRSDYLTHAMHRKQTHGHDEGVGKAGHRVRQLNPKLSVIVIKPTARNHRAISSGDTCLSEKSSQYVADYPTDGVRGEDL